MKKLVTLLLLLSLALCSFATGAVAEELPTVTLFCPDNGSVEYPLSFEDRPVLKEICNIARERFGLELKLETVIGSEFKTVLNTRMASGEDMPDLVRTDSGTTTPGDLVNFYNQGLILDLSQYAELMPNYVAATEAYPGVKAATSDSEGHMLAISQIVVNPQHITQWMCLRHDWLDALQLPVPTTLDELQATLKAFQDNDMNGNGLPDEVMMCHYFSAMNQVMFPAFGEGRMADARSSWGVDADGRVFNTMVGEAAKEYVTYMNKLFADGLIWDQSFASPTGEEMTQLRITDACSGTFSAFWDGLLWDTEMNAYGLSAKYAPVKPVEGKITVTNYEGGAKFFITSSCPAPEKVIEFLDWFYTVEGTQMSYYGEVAPGGNYYVRDTSTFDSIGLTAQEYVMTGTDKYYEELALEANLNMKLGANTAWPHYMPGTADDVAADFYFGYDADVCGLNCDVNYVCDTLNWAMDNGTYAPLFSAMTTEQTEVFTKYADVFSFMDEKIKAFISGADSLDNWDAFVAQCEAMGLPEVTAVMQARLVTK